MNKKSQNICFISLQAYSLFNSLCGKPHGGSEVQLYQLAKKLALDDDFLVSFIVGDFGQNKNEKYNNISVVKAFSLKHCEYKYITGLFYQFKFLQVLYSVNADVYIQRAAGIETGLLALFCKLFGKKFIYMTASSIDVDGSFRKRDWIANIFYSFGLKNASVIVTQNKEHQELIDKNYGKKSFVIKNSFIIPVEVLTIEEREFILWVGSAQDLKQPQNFLEMARAITGEKFVMIMPKHNENLWKKIKEESGEIPNFQFIEKVPFDQINEYFAKAKLFVNTSVFEGFPNTFVQATMNGTPIASLNVNPDNFLDEFSCGVCAMGNTAALTDKSKALLENKEEMRRMSRNARAYAEEFHDINKNILKLKESF